MARSKLHGLAMQVASQFGLGSPIGQWILGVSQQSSHPSQAVAKDYVQTSYSAGGGQSLAANTDIVMDTPGYGDIPYNPLNGVFTLTGNKNYRLTAHFTLANYTGETTNIGIEWVDANTNAVLHADHGAFLTPVTNTNNENFQPTAETFHTPSVNQTVKLRVTGATGTADALGGLSYALVQEV
jgi:hypothetical protein